MRHIFLYIVFIVFHLNLRAGNHLDSLKHYLKQKPKLTGYLDGRNSFAEASKNQIFGAFIGANYGSRLDVGLAWYTTYNEPEIQEYFNVGTPAQDTLFHKSYYNYFSFRVAYEFYHSRKWEFSIPVGIGLGKAQVTSYKKNPNKPYLPHTDEPGMAPLDLGLDGTYLFTPWFVFSGGIGYRQNLVRSNLNPMLSAVYYRFGFGIRLGYIYKKFKSSKFGKNCCCCML